MLVVIHNHSSNEQYVLEILVKETLNVVIIFQSIYKSSISYKCVSRMIWLIWSTQFLSTYQHPDAAK